MLLTHDQGDVGLSDEKGRGGRKKNVVNNDSLHIDLDKLSLSRPFSPARQGEQGGGGGREGGREGGEQENHALTSMGGNSSVIFCPRAHPARVREGMTRRAICVELPTAMPMASSIRFLAATVTAWEGEGKRKRRRHRE